MPHMRHSTLILHASIRRALACMKSACLNIGQIRSDRTTLSTLKEWHDPLLHIGADGAAAGGSGGGGEGGGATNPVARN